MNNLELLNSAIKMIADSNPEYNTELDLTKKEDVEKFHKLIAEIKDNSFWSALVSSLTGKDINLFDKLDEFADNFYEEVHKDDQPETNKVEIDRPSAHIPTNVGLQIHKLVQEYIDTMIKPYSKGILDNNTINNSYVGLYEFACWIFNKEK